MSQQTVEERMKIGAGEVIRIFPEHLQHPGGGVVQMDPIHRQPPQPLGGMGGKAAEGAV